MRKQVEENGGDSGRSAGDRPAAQSKKVYRTPRLVTYGNLRDLSLGAGGGKSDGAGPPRSRA
jgi:hypothetical protein